LREQRRDLGKTKQVGSHSEKASWYIVLADGTFMTAQIGENTIIVKIADFWTYM